MARDFARKFYKSKEWQKTRDYILKRDNYLCCVCGQPAEEVHHIEHLSPVNIDKPEVTMHGDNLQSLCRSCHFDAHRGEHGLGRQKREETGADQFYFDADGVIQKKNIPPSN